MRIWNLSRERDGRGLLRLSRESAGWISRDDILVGDLADLKGWETREGWIGGTSGGRMSADLDTSIARTGSLT